MSISLCLKQGRSHAFAESFSFLSLLNLIHVHLGLCCHLSFCSSVTPSSCLQCRDSSLSELLPVQKVCPPITGSGPDAAYNSISVQTLFSSCIHCPTCLVPWAVLPGVLALGDTLCLVNQSCWSCHGACFQRCRTEIHPDSL